MVTMRYFILIDHRVEDTLVNPKFEKELRETFKWKLRAKKLKYPDLLLGLEQRYHSAILADIAEEEDIPFVLFKNTAVIGLPIRDPDRFTELEDRAERVIQGHGHVLLSLLKKWLQEDQSMVLSIFKNYEKKTATTRLLRGILSEVESESILLQKKKRKYEKKQKSKKSH